jgi:hypothetical protein
MLAHGENVWIETCDCFVFSKYPSSVVLNDLDANHIDLERGVCAWSAVTQRIVCLYQHIINTVYYTKQNHVNCCLNIKNSSSLLWFPKIQYLFRIGR